MIGNVQGRVCPHGALVSSAIHRFAVVTRLLGRFAMLVGGAGGIGCKVVVLCAMVLPGCTHTALRESTVQTTATLTDLHFQQVLDNVARFHDDPNSVPSFALASTGNVSVTDTAGVGVSPTYAPTLSSAQQGGGALPILSLMFPLSTQRAINESWTLAPVTDADSLRRLRSAYQLLVLGDGAPGAASCRKHLMEISAADAAKGGGAFPPRGWYTCGMRTDIPSDAKYIGRHGTTYVWVTADGTDGLALFALAALDMASGKSRTSQRTVVRKYNGDARPENIIETLVTTIEDSPDPVVAAREQQAQSQSSTPLGRRQHWHQD